MSVSKALPKPGGRKAGRKWPQKNTSPLGTPIVTPWLTNPHVSVRLRHHSVQHITTNAIRKQDKNSTQNRKEKHKHRHQLNGA